MCANKVLILKFHQRFKNHDDQSTRVTGANLGNESPNLLSMPSTVASARL